MPDHDAPKMPPNAPAVIAALQMQHELGLWADADAYVVRSHDPEAGPKDATLTGPFDNEAAAFAYRAHHDEELNRGLKPGEAPFVVDVLPLYHPSMPAEPADSSTSDD